MIHMTRDTARVFTIGFFTCLFLLGGLKFLFGSTKPEPIIDGAYAMEYFERCVEVTSRVYQNKATDEKLDEIRSYCRQIATEYSAIPNQATMQ